jgi:vanillate O-demethylase monooxygenase subunit
VTLVRNTWYVAAWPHEITKEALFSRTICNETMVFWRGFDDVVTALENRCPHRELPLAMGIIEAGDVRCRYHGLRFGVDGRCNEIPGQDPAASSFVAVSRPGGAPLGTR